MYKDTPVLCVRMFYWVIGITWATAVSGNFVHMHTYAATQS